MPRSLVKSNTALRRDVVSAGLHLSVNPSSGGRQETLGRVMRQCVGAAASPCFDSELRISRAVRSTYNNTTTILAYTTYTTNNHNTKQTDTYIAFDFDFDFQDTEQSRAGRLVYLYIQGTGAGTGCGGSWYVPSHFRVLFVMRQVRDVYLHATTRQHLSRA